MFNKSEFKKLCKERETIDFYADWEVDEVLHLLINLICKDDNTFNEFITYMKTEMTDYEYSTLSEISDELAFNFPSMEFIKAYKTLAKKYPQTTEKYKIEPFIKDAEKIVKCSLKEMEDKGK